MVNYKVSDYRGINIAGEVANLITNAVILIKPESDIDANYSFPRRLQRSTTKNTLFEAGLK